MATPIAEQRPDGLDLEWAHLWDNALKTLKSQGTWTLESRPLLNEFVWASRAAVVARTSDDQVNWDRHAKRAMALADQLALTPRGRKAAGIGDSDEAPVNEFENVLSFPRSA